MGFYNICMYGIRIPFHSNCTCTLCNIAFFTKYMCTQAKKVWDDPQHHYAIITLSIVALVYPFVYVTERPWKFLNPYCHNHITPLFINKTPYIFIHPLSLRLHYSYFFNIHNRQFKTRKQILFRVRCNFCKGHSSRQPLQPNIIYAISFVPSRLYKM